MAAKIKKPPSLNMPCRWFEQKQLLIRGESLDVMRTLIEKGVTVDGILADPPYASGGLHIGAKSQSTSSKYLQTQTTTRYTDFSGDARDQLSWIAWQSMWLSLAGQMLMPGSPVMLFCDWRQLAATITALQTAGFIYRGVAVWTKPNGRPANGRFRNQAEYIVWGSHGPMRKNDRYLPGVFNCSPPSTKTRIHQTQKPVALLTEILKILTPGQRVLDPFAGSGSTIIAAIDSGLNAIGIEQNKTIYDAAADRIENHEVA